MKFPTRDIISVVTGYHVSNEPKDFLCVLDYMTGVNLYTHQYPRAAVPCRDALIAQYPQLGNLDFSTLSVDEMLAKRDRMIAILGEELEVNQLSEDVYPRMDALTELEQMTDKPIVQVLV